MKLYIMVGDNPEGPLGLDQLRSLMRAGKVNMQTLAWMDGQSEWVPLGSVASVVSGLFPPFPNGTTPAVDPRTTPSSQPPAPDPVASSSTPTNGVTASSMEGGEMFALVALVLLVAVYLLVGPWSHFKVGMLMAPAIAMQPKGASRQPRIRTGLLWFGITQLAAAGIYYFGIHSYSLPMTGEAAGITARLSRNPSITLSLAVGLISLIMWLVTFASTHREQRSNARTS